MHIRAAALAAMLAAAGVFSDAAAYEVEPQSAAAHFAGRSDLTPVEGIWLWNSGALVSIESDYRGALRLILIYSPDPLIDTPCDIGTGTFGGSEGTYILDLSTIGDATHRQTPGKKTQRFVARLGSAGQLSLKPFTSGFNFNPLRMLPYLFRIGVTSSQSPDGIDGAVRVYPLTPTQQVPIVL